jgi:hypothetical protein
MESQNMAKQSKAEKANEKRIEKQYYARCSGVQIDIMNIGRVFLAGQAAIAHNPEITDAELGDKVAAFVETIREN